MKTRIDAGTDVAMIGAWDESRNASTLPKVPFKQIMNTLREDAQAGQLFLGGPAACSFASPDDATAFRVGEIG